MNWHWCEKEMSISGCLEGFPEEAVSHWQTPAQKGRHEMFWSEMGMVLEKVRSSYNLTPVTVQPLQVLETTTDKCPRQTWESTLGQKVPC